MSMFGFGRGNPFAGDQTANYNTRLSPSDEQSFQTWRSALPANLQSMSDYDLRGAWKGDAQQATNGHLPDTYKKPNHMTFSDESAYSSPATPGGTWAQLPDQSWVFMAAPTNLAGRDPSDLLNYFQAYEPGNAVMLPRGNPFRRSK